MPFEPKKRLLELITKNELTEGELGESVEIVRLICEHNDLEPKDFVRTWAFGSGAQQQIFTFIRQRKQ